MKYIVDFEKEINFMLKNNIGLCPHFHKSVYKYFYWQHRYEFFTRNEMPYLRGLLNNETLFENPLFHLLFKAFVYAEIRFIDKYIPQNSHEERLTGHLISEIASSLNIITETFEQKAFELYNSKLNLEFYYADLSSNKNEKETGADFGLLFHINLPDYQEKVNVAIMQAKKFDKNATIDSKQLDKLEKYAEESGYYCFYDMNKERNSPLIQKADTIKSILDKNKHKSLQRKEITNHDGYGSIPLSVFLIFDMLNSENENIKSFANLRQAKEFIEKPRNRFRNENHQVSKVLTVSIGGTSSSQGLEDPSKLFSFDPYIDEDITEREG
jgi:hypothetical protein